jgi:TonB family protein
VVVVSALVSETGRVLQARVLRGINPDLGLNAAAVDAVRGSTFRPATKDGVRVKTYTTVAVNFKL